MHMHTQIGRAMDKDEQLIASSPKKAASPHSCHTHLYPLPMDWCHCAPAWHRQLSIFSNYDLDRATLAHASQTSPVCARSLPAQLGAHLGREPLKNTRLAAEAVTSALQTQLVVTGPPPLLEDYTSHQTRD